MTFLENIVARLQRSSGSPVVREIRDGQITSATGAEFLEMVHRARSFLASRGLKKSDRCALIAPNSIRWAAMDLAMMAEGIIVVPLYSRQAPAELVGMMKDSTPAHIFCSEDSIASEIRKIWPGAPPITALNVVFDSGAAASAPQSRVHADSDPVTIIYTSGTSGEPKGVVLTAANVTHMLGCTNSRLNQLMGSRQEPDKIFHYLPFCFAGSWILLLTALSRDSVLTLSTDLSKLSDELKLASPDYFLNVPALLERVRGKIEETIQKRGGFGARIFMGAKRADGADSGARASITDALYLRIANAAIFPKIRKSIGPNLRAIICGSAPLAAETQRFFIMLGIPVLQVYGLTETTAICTMDNPGHVEPGRVGVAIPGVEMKVADNGEILVRGPNIFHGYWQRPAETVKVLDEWFHTGDQGEADVSGNWRITGRLKNLIILNSGHNIAPEPLEESLAARLPEAQQLVLVGNQRSFLAALITTAPSGGGNGLNSGRIQSAIDAINSGLPHYKQIRAFHLISEPFTIENGLLTANGKLKRDAIAARFAAEVEQLFSKKPA